MAVTVRAAALDALALALAAPAIVPPLPAAAREVATPQGDIAEWLNVDYDGPPDEVDWQLGAPPASLEFAQTYRIEWIVRDKAEDPAAARQRFENGLAAIAAAIAAAPTLGGNAELARVTGITSETASDPSARPVRAAIITVRAMLRGTSVLS